MILKVNKKIIILTGFFESKMNSPNILTIFRIILAPIIAILIWRETSNQQLTLAFLLFLVAGVTDWLDGYLARKLDAQSHLGRILDPIADKVLVACVLLALASHYEREWIFIVPTLIIFLREFIISSFREYMSNQGVLINVSVLAKWKTTIQIISIGLIIISMIFGENTIIAHTSIASYWLAAIITVHTGIEYLRSGISKLKSF